MKDRCSQPKTLSAAQRGQIVQRVIVDGWKTADAAAAADVPERLVAAWVANYRRHGMASLRHRPGKTVAVEVARLRLVQPLRAIFHRLAAGVRRLFAPERPAAMPLPIRRSQDDRRGGS